MIATSTLAWGQFTGSFSYYQGNTIFDAKIEAYRDMDLTDILQMMGRAGRPAYDTSGIAIVIPGIEKYLQTFLNLGFPVESSLQSVR